MPSQLAAFRKSPQQEDLVRLAEQHLNHDLDESDRDLLKAAASKLPYHTGVGTLVGLGLGLYAAYRVRRVRMDVFRAFWAGEKPRQVVFNGGRTQNIPDLTPMMQPTKVGDAAAYFFFGLGGLFLGGETGLLTGSYSAARMLRREPERYRRIENAYRRFRVDALRAEADRLDGGGESVWRW